MVRRVDDPPADGLEAESLQEFLNLIRRESAAPSAKRKPLTVARVENQARCIGVAAHHPVCMDFERLLFLSRYTAIVLKNLDPGTAWR